MCALGDGNSIVTPAYVEFNDMPGDTMVMTNEEAYITSVVQDLTEMVRTNVTDVVDLSNNVLTVKGTSLDLNITESTNFTTSAKELSLGYESTKKFAASELATTNSAGLMSKSDKQTIDALPNLYVKTPVQTADIDDGAVTNTKIGDEAVSGRKIRDKSVTRGKIADSAVDSTPTTNSNNLVTSGGVKSALVGKVDKSGGTMTGPLEGTEFSVVDTVGGCLKLVGEAAGTFFFYRNGWHGASSPMYQVYMPDANGTLSIAAGRGYAGNLAALDADGNPVNSGISTNSIVKTPVYNGQNHDYLAAKSLVPGEDFTITNIIHRWTMPRKGIVYVRLMSNSNSSTVRIGVNVAGGAVDIDDAHCITSISGFKYESSTVVPLFLNAGDEVCLLVTTNPLKYVLFSCFYTD